MFLIELQSYLTNGEFLYALLKLPTTDLKSMYVLLVEVLTEEDPRIKTFYKEFELYCTTAIYIAFSDPNNL